MSKAKLKAPFPWFGGKSRAAKLIWARLGETPNYIEPFAGSLAVLLGRPWAPARYETVNDLDCVGPDTRILRADLTWAKASEIKAGDYLVGFDEFNGPARDGLRAPARYRRWAVTRVTGVSRLLKPSYRLAFDDGTTVIASADHLWLGGSHRTGGRGWRWQRTAGLVCNRKTQRSWVCKLVDVTERESSYEAGWLGGFMDGEGTVKPSPGWQASLSQKPGAEWRRAIKLLGERGFRLREDSKTSSTAHNLCIVGGMPETFRLLMRVRPERLIRKLVETLPERSLYGRSHHAVGLVEKEFLGDHPVVAIETDSHTFVAEGLASHNCYVANFWRAVTADPEQVAYHADWPVNEACLTARHRYLVRGWWKAKFRRRMLGDPFYYDAMVAGWWVWGISCWIGAGWCDERSEWWGYEDERNRGRAMHDRVKGSKNGRPQKVPENVPRIGGPGGKTGVHKDSVGFDASGVRPDLASDGKGVHGVDTTLPYIHRPRGVTQAVPEGRAHLQRHYEVHKPPPVSMPRGAQLPELLSCKSSNTVLLDWMSRLADRLRYVRVCCGDWSRIMGKAILTAAKPCAILLDPPYSAEADRHDGIYSVEDLSVAHDVRDWCIEHGGDKSLRIALCGYEGEGHEALVEQHGWDVQSWKASGGYGRIHGDKQGRSLKNRHRERVYFSPGCLPRNDMPLFAQAQEAVE